MVLCVTQERLQAKQVFGSELSGMTHLEENMMDLIMEFSISEQGVIEAISYCIFNELYSKLACNMNIYCIFNQYLIC